MLSSVRTTKLNRVPRIGSSNNYEIGIAASSNGCNDTLSGCVRVDIDDVFAVKLSASFGESLVFNMAPGKTARLVEGNSACYVKGSSEACIGISNHWNIRRLDYHASQLCHFRRSDDRQIGLERGV